MGDGAQDFYFVDDVVGLLGLDDVILFHYFGTAVLPVLFILDQLDLAERPCSQDAHELVVIHLDGLLFDVHVIFDIELVY
jgi:hypothetical protein